jgi:bifunctional enzyme CysN/CysC
MDEELDSALVHEAITITLDQEIDIARGDMLVDSTEPPSVLTQCEAMLVWMSTQPLVPGRPYWLKHTTRRTTCEVERIAYRTDVNTLRKLDSPTLKLNEIGRCILRTVDPLVMEAYDRNREIGSFILVDRISHETVAAGMFVDPSGSPERSGPSHEQSHSQTHYGELSLVSADTRARRYQQRPLTVLITGLSSSGKTSVAMELERILFERGCTCVLLDGQLLRAGISRDLAYSAEERSENLRRAAEITKLINDAGQICIAAFVAPSAWVRNKAKQLIGAERFFHVHLTTNVATCRARDRTGQYHSADKGEILSFPGVTFPYETPNNADLTFDTETQAAEEIAMTIVHAIEPRWLLASSEA